MNLKSNSQELNVPENPLQLSGGTSVSPRLRFQKCFTLDSKRVNEIADRAGYCNGIFFDRGRGKIFVDCMPVADGTLVTRTDCQKAEKEMFIGYLAVPQPYYRAVCHEQLYVNMGRKRVKATLFAGPNGEKLHPIRQKDNILFIFGEGNVFLTGEFDGITSRFRLSRTIILDGKVYSQCLQWWKYLDLTNDATRVISFLENRALSFCGSSKDVIADFVITGMVVAYNQVTNAGTAYWSSDEQLEQYPSAQQIDVPKQKEIQPKTTTPATSGSDLADQFKKIRPAVVASHKEAEGEENAQQNRAEIQSEKETISTTPQLKRTRKPVGNTTGKKARKAAASKTEPAAVTVTVTA